MNLTKAQQTRRKEYTKDERRQMVQTESDLQSMVEEYLLKTGWVKPGRIADQKGLVKGVFLHVPNQAFQSKRTVVSDYLKNWPDLILFHPDGRYLSFELKSRSGKSMRGQRALAKYLLVEKEQKVFENIVKRIEEWYERRKNN